MTEDRRPFVIGVGMTTFLRPSSSQPYDVMAEEAGREALADAGIAYSDVGAVFTGYVYGESTSGQRAAYRLGLTGVPVQNINNNCATGSSALYSARQAILAGDAECVLVLGFEQMPPGALSMVYNDRVHPLERHIQVLSQHFELEAAPPMPQMFGQAAREWLRERELSASVLADIAVKARKHAANNPRAVFRDALTREQILASPMVFDPLNKLQCCPPTCGAAAAVLCSPDFLRKHGIQGRVQVRLAGQVMTSDTDSSFTGRADTLVGSQVTANGADRLYAATGIDPRDVDVVELHDCFTINEALAYEGLRLCTADGLPAFISDGEGSYGGQVVVNPSGGLLSKGHPLGATGLAQCAELVWQLRGEAGARQVEGARIALQHNIGLGGACVVGLYERVS
ncbi:MULTISPECIES: beta-ketoacyl synthase N-terminal-like domain-containing protein [unclassified Pseudomonas]|uniref:thiolase C-terminal domain-containing protein n=1 Tax=unclassified Pseudomonas TaxID=196821 RepID=UPI0015A0CFC4|nr:MULTISPECIES: beta-ketoacyl synthase N-terminal-like domain-containing protein [unclassified Pseudomonas]NWC92987.1 lipid-transfer protein [Pseudomonas sp. IPO3779]NWD19405.1 lipid-transfer protein [Pseudomonas sp. IPO3778]